MKTEISLLDLLTLQMNCAYLSDLRSLNDGQRALLAHRLERLEAKTEDLWDWNDALEYLTGTSPERTAQAAKERLIALLAQPRNPGKIENCETKEVRPMGTKGKREEETDGLKPKGVQRLRELREENADLRIKLGELERQLEKEYIEHKMDTILLDYASGTPALPAKEESEPSDPGTEARSPPAAPHGGHRTPPQNSKAHGFARIMGNFMFYLAIVLMLAGAVMIRSTRSSAPVSITGYSGLVVLSESMQDAIPKGSFILTKHVEPETLQIGDDITFMTNSVTCVTHRIVDIRPQPDGTLAFQTKGVNNQTPDSNLVAAGNVVGKVVYHNLLLGQIAQWISANWPLVLFLLAVWAALSWVLKRTMRLKEGGRRLQKRNSAPAEPAGTAEKQ